MSTASRNAMEARRPGLRPLIITRSTFAGSGRHVGKWLGDNVASWEQYRFSISGLLQFGSLYQVPMVGSDVCGFTGEPEERLCARWATLGAFSPFYRSHQNLGFTPHEFYRWELTAAAARNAIAIRYRLLDYIYTAMWRQSLDGTPLVQPLFFHYPTDATADNIDLQYFYGPGVMVAPVTEANATEVEIYFPTDSLFYDFATGEAIQSNGEYVTVSGVDFDQIPLYYEAGIIYPLRVESANTTTALRQKDFELVVALDADGKAAGNCTSMMGFLFNKRQRATSPSRTRMVR